MPSSDEDVLSALPRRAMVTGGSGFIGHHVVRRLLEEGVEVTCLVLPGDKAPLLDGLDVRRVDGDLRDPAALMRALEGAEIVFHLAAIYAIWLPDPNLIFQVNVEGTRTVMETARKAGAPRVVYTSSIAAVGVAPDRGVSDETVGFNDWGVADPYVFSKYISELEALMHNRDGLEVVAVNPAFPFGPGDVAPTPTGRLVLEAIRGRLPFFPAGGFNAVDVRDVAEGHLLAAVKGRAGERYILGGHNCSYEEFAGEVARAIGRKPPRRSVPPAVLKAYGWLSEQVAEYVTHRPPAATYRSAAYTAGRFLWFSVDKARDELGYEPRPLSEAVEASVSWFQGFKG